MPTHTDFPKATYRYDPYRNFRFRVKLDGRYVAGVARVSGLTSTTEVSGGDPGTPRRMPGQSEYSPITLERGVTHDVAFEQWANKVWAFHNSPAYDRQDATTREDVSLADFRRDLILEVYNEAGQKVISYKIYHCWPSEFTAVPELDSSGSAVAIEMLKLENEGWERDTSVNEPLESSDSYTLPTS